jgi:F0F1-type ATP synthase assembly protein I
MQKWQAAFRFIGLGWFVAACILLGGFGGRWLDNHLDTGPLLTVVGLVAGTAVAFYGVYRMILPAIGKKNNKGNG